MSNEAKKYELVKSESIVHNGRTLYRIRALREFTISRGVAIKVGDIGAPYSDPAARYGMTRHMKTLAMARQLILTAVKSC